MPAGAEVQPGNRQVAAHDAFIAVNRFGLGARPGELAQAGRDPKSWLKRQLATADAPRGLAGLASGSERMRDFLMARAARGDKGQRKLLQQEFREAYITEAAARLRTQVDSQTPFRERLVAFWSNH